MHEISRFFGIVIKMFFDDHNPPHFHAEYSGDLALIDIRNLSVCQTAMKGIEYVFHQAALASVQRSVEDPLTSNSVNAEGTLNVLLAARDAGVKRFIFAASSSAYGNSPVLPKKENMKPG
jgi:nucleoside-diphosphate-sugar epimerase